MPRCACPAFVRVYQLRVYEQVWAVTVNVPVRLIDFVEGDPSRRDAHIRAQSMIDTLKHGSPLPPIWLTRKPRGRFAIWDGNARLTAYRAAGRRVVPIAILPDVPYDQVRALPSIPVSVRERLKETGFRC